MPDKEKVIKGLKICTSPCRRCTECPYENCDINLNCALVMCGDALELLKEQEAEIAFLKEIQLQTIHNMSDEDIGNAVRNVLRL